jgi:hypothetical protein
MGRLSGVGCCFGKRGGIQVTCIVSGSSHGAVCVGGEPECFWNVETIGKEMEDD